MGCQWVGMGKDLMRLPIFAQSISECHQILLEKNVDLIRVITDDNPELLDNVLNCFVGITAIQVSSYTYYVRLIFYRSLLVKFYTRRTG